MEAKDTVMTINQWLDVIGCDNAYRKDMKETYQKMVKELEAQAGIAFKAGMKEVVEFVENEFWQGIYSTTTGGQIWRAFLKEKGL